LELFCCEGDARWTIDVNPTCCRYFFTSFSVLLMHCAFLVFSPLLFPPLPSRHFPFLLFPFPPLPFRWVTVKVKGCKIQGIFCSKFLAFANSDSVFTDRFFKFSHTYQRSSEHESSISHNAAVAAVVSCQNSHDIASVINRDWLSCKKSRC